MSESSSFSSDTIVALSTPAGVAALAVLRISGPDALGVLRPLLKAEQEPKVWKPCHAFYRHLHNRVGDVIDDAVLLYWKGPHSYTGEDTVEITCHGNPRIVDRLLHEILSHGARLARPGEFTQRAYFNDKLTLTQAEGVLDVLTAVTPRALAGAQAMKSGLLGRRLEEVRGELIDILSHLEASLDFAEEGIEPEVGAQFRLRLDRVQSRFQELLRTSSLGRILREGARVVIAGEPNVGKSSLLNALLREDRAIVSPTPGTTRDIIEATCNIRGLPVRLIDTAGRRETLDPIEAEGVRRAQDCLQQAELILEVIEPKKGEPSGKGAFLSGKSQNQDRPEAPPRLDWPAGTPRLLVINKIDLLDSAHLPDLPDQSLAISVQTGAGLDALELAIEKALLGQSGAESVDGLTLNARQSSTLQKAADAMAHAQDALASNLGLEAISIDLRDVLDALAEVIGETTNEDILTRLFLNFCIGK